MTRVRFSGESAMAEQVWLRRRFFQCRSRILQVQFLGKLFIAYYFSCRIIICSHMKGFENALDV
jgi:hypothetical protein